MAHDSEATPPDLHRLLPRISPLGVLEPAENDSASPRTYPRSLRIAALVIVGVFLAVIVVTTSLSLGRYCLTTDAGSRWPTGTSAH